MPSWVEKYKKKGVEIKRIKQQYYAYSRHSVWDSVRKKPKTITDKYLGKVTPEGIILPKHEKVMSGLSKASVKEFGATHLISFLAKDFLEELKKCYPDDWQTIFAMAVLRFFHTSPLKNMSVYFSSSVLSDEYPAVDLTPKHASDFLQALGADRQRAVDFLKRLIVESEHLIIDVTAIYSQASTATYPALGHNSDHSYLPQINMLLLFSKEKNKPVFFRLLPGSITDVSSIKLTIEESGLHDVIFVGDKGFYSATNTVALKKSLIKYILPLRRNLSFLDYTSTQSTSKKQFDGYFFFEKRPIWFKKNRHEDDSVILFLDESLKLDEQQGFLQRVSKKNSTLTINDYHEYEHTFGTIAVITNQEATPEDIYSCLKSRLHIEQAFDTFKNTLEADRTYMRTDHHLQGWLFINFISLYFYYCLYGILLSNKLLNKFSPKDIILHFSKVHKITLQEKEIITELPKTVRILLEKMKLNEDTLSQNTIPTTKPMP